MSTALHPLYFVEILLLQCLQITISSVPLPILKLFVRFFFFEWLIKLCVYSFLSLFFISLSLARVFAASTRFVMSVKRSARSKFLSYHFSTFITSYCDVTCFRFSFIFSWHFMSCLFRCFITTKNLWSRNLHFYVINS